MGLTERAAEVAGRLKDGARALVSRAKGTGKARSGAGSGERVLRIARLPSRIYADGPAERGVTAEGLFGLARLTLHEAELNNSAAVELAEPAATGGKSTPDKRRSRCYAVLSVGLQTFASSRVRRSLPDSQAAPPASAPMRFEWNESTDMVLQRGGASIAQVAIYKAGRVDGALGDRLQCLCQLDLASYFEGHTGAEAASPGEPAAADGGLAVEGLAAEEPLAPPPALLLTITHATSEARLEESTGALQLEPAEGQGQQEEASAQPSADGSSLAGTERAEEASEAPAAADSGSHLAADSNRACAGDSTAAQHLHPSATSTTNGEVLHDRWLPLVDPGDASVVLGRVRVTVRASTPANLEQQLWRRLLALADLNGNGTLCAAEFAGLLEALGSELDPTEVSDLFAQADRNSDGTVDSAELAAVLTGCHQEGELHRLMRRCPVDGAELAAGDDVANIMYVALALDDGTGESLRGGYTTPEQVSRSWLLSMSEWATQPLLGAPSALWRGNRYKAGGLREGADAAHILVFDRKTKRVVEEAVSPALTLAMRAMYQSRAGRMLLREGALKKLKRMSEKYGAYADSPESAADIPKFLKTFQGQVDMLEALDPNISSYKSFNQFFYRKLKPEARPIAAPGDPDVICSAADCRLMVYDNVGDATRCWIKGKQFSLAGLLADGGQAATFEGGSLAIFRLAPQDYHRFHVPVGGRVVSITDVPGELLTVNPIAVNSAFADVFTRNKRSVLRLSCPGYGEVAYVAIGATVVGSILWTVDVGQEVAKGAEAGYFAFGGSTIVVLFNKGAAAWDPDLVQNSLKSLETRVLMGEHMGVRGSGEGASSPPPASAAPAPADVAKDAADRGL